MISKLLFLSTLRWHLRLPIKAAILMVTIVVVCFPYPRVLLRHIEHWRDPNALIEPDAPELQAWIEELRPRMEQAKSPKQSLKIVQDHVYRHIKYAWDWDTWGNADYMPTVGEALAAGKEDCDGRAVVAASLLKGFGYDAKIVTDFAHVWVKTEHGETMGPGKRKAIVADKRGLKLQAGALTELPKALAYGTAAFPWERELIVLLVLWWLMLRRGISDGCSLSGLILMLVGLDFLRAGGIQYLNPIVWMQFAGLLCFAAAFLVLVVLARRSGQHAAPQNAE